LRRNTGNFAAARRGGRRLPPSEYLTVPTPTHILLVDTEVPRLDVLSRGSGEIWTSTRHEGLDAKTDLATVSATLDLAEVFEGIQFDAA
jgi:hypothetical protein